MGLAPVGLPGLAALAAGGLAFFLALIVARSRRERESGGKRSSRSIAGIVVQGLGMALVFIGPVSVRLDPLGAVAAGEAAVVTLLMAASVTLFVWSSRTMGRNWSLVARTRSDHELVTTGPFAHVRHPIYVAMALTMLATSIALGHERALLIGVPLFAIGTWLRISEEERLLRAMFGDEYGAYAARVRRFVPGVF
ncbi:methyltransferase family protein [Sphingomonas sp. EC-HK361]|uniref:methyltransferase family protein n=1 Tax=Sphingomonas sp. EC-HK361 TaxID=2038397 RepID=UPI001F2417D1|nr:isoprenylcysteine carboxylmethyltransferase family protein [Sphingomonas sp. EC-HK361]